jgi:hypothetical protein
LAHNHWLATGNFFTSYREGQRIFLTHLDRSVFTGFLILLFAWPLLFDLSSKYMLVFVVISGFAARNLLRTRYGRCLVAVRDNDRAADAMGMHPGFTRVYAFALAGSAAEGYFWTTSYRLMTEKGEGTEAQIAMAKRYGRDDAIANSQNYTNGVQVTQIAVETMIREKAKGKKITRQALYEELLGMNGYNAYYPLNTVGPVTYSKTDRQGVDSLQLYVCQDGVFRPVGLPFSMMY